MSTEAPTRRTRSRDRRGRSFALTFLVVVGILAVVGIGGAAASVLQGPRVTSVQVDPEAAVAASGSRLIVTTTQALQEVDPSQVTVEPATPFAVDTSGRSVGVRFTLPLWDDTEYTVTFRDVRGTAAGPAATFEHTFRTPPAEVFLLQRGEASDTIFRTDLTGEQAEPVFTHEHIEDYRATTEHLVMSVRTEDDDPQLIVTDLDGQAERTLALPGDGFVSNLQSADRGDLIGYTFSAADLGGEGGLESALFTASLKDGEADAPPQPIEVEGADPRVAEFRFVPDTDSILLLSFDGSLLLTSPDGQATSLGIANGIDGIARGSSHAIVDRAEGVMVVDLTDGTEAPLVAPDAALGPASSVLPLATGGTVRSTAVLTPEGFPTGVTSVDRVADDGVTSALMSVPSSDGLLQTCVSPSERYLAVLVSPDAVDNPYDTYMLPLPQRVETHILDLTSADAEGAEELVAMSGSSISWCQVPPL